MKPISAEPVRYTIEDLVYLMQKLRDPDKGCPWDLKQSFETIVPSTLEEVYEVVDAIERQDYDNLGEELGDLLFQVVFYSQLASESALFDFNDVAHRIVEKLVRRHPHVFPTGELRGDDSADRNIDDATLHAQWERIKQEEKRHRQAAPPGVLDGIPLALPALQRAFKIQKKLAGVGFDWQSASELFPVVEAELQECRDAVTTGSRPCIEEELGDVLFAVVNLCRHLKVDPEHALRAANHKVEQRFASVEAGLRSRGKTPESASMAEMETLWQQAKNGRPAGAE